MSQKLDTQKHELISSGDVEGCVSQAILVAGPVDFFGTALIVYS